MASGTGDADDIDALLSVNDLGRPALAPALAPAVTSRRTAARRPAVFMTDIVGESAVRGTDQFDVMAAHLDAARRGESVAHLPRLPSPPRGLRYTEVSAEGPAELWLGGWRSHSRVAVAGDATHGVRRAPYVSGDATAMGSGCGDAEVAGDDVEFGGGDDTFGAAGLGDDGYDGAGGGKHRDNAVSDGGRGASAQGGRSVVARALQPAVEPTGLDAEQRLRGIRGDSRVAADSRMATSAAARAPRPRVANAAATAPRRRLRGAGETQQGTMERWARGRQVLVVSAVMRLGHVAAGEAQPPPRWQPVPSRPSTDAAEGPGAKRTRFAVDIHATDACAGGGSGGGGGGGVSSGTAATAAAAAAAAAAVPTAASAPATPAPSASALPSVAATGAAAAPRPPRLAAADTVAGDGVCVGCGEPASHGFAVVCGDCGLLCARCDAAAHADERALAHRRCMRGGIDLHPGVFVHPATGHLYEHGLHVDFRPWYECPCGARCWLQMYEPSPGDAPGGAPLAPTNRGRRLLGGTLQGVVVLIVPLRVECGSCGGGSVDHRGNAVPLSRVRPADCLDVMNGWWPQSPSEPSVLLSVQMLDVVAACRRERNNLGDEALQAVLTRLARVQSGDSWAGGRDYTDAMRRVSWAVAVAERLQLLFELDVFREATDAHTCAVCGVAPNKIAVDVIKKLSRYVVPGAGSSHAYNFGVFLPTAETDAHEANFPPECDRAGGDGAAAAGSVTVDDGCTNVRAGRSSRGAAGKAKLAIHGVAGYGCPHVLLALYALDRDETYLTKHLGTAHVAAVLHSQFLLGDNICAEQHLAATRAAADVAAVRTAHDAADACVAADANAEVAAVAAAAAAASSGDSAAAAARDNAREHARGLALYAATTAEAVVRRLQGSAAAAGFHDRALAAIYARHGAPVARMSVSAAAIAAVPLVPVTPVAPSGAVAEAFAWGGAGGSPLALPAANAAAAPAAAVPAAPAPAAVAAAAAGRGAVRGAARRTAPRDVPHLCPCVHRGHHALAAPLPDDPAAYSTAVEGRVNARTPYLHGAFHRVDCQLRYEVLYTPGTGWFDGEFIERHWARLYSMGRLVRGCSYAVWLQHISYAVLVINADVNRRAHEIALQQLRAALVRAERLTAEFEADWGAAFALTAPGVCVLSQQDREVVRLQGVDVLMARWLTAERRWLCGGGAAAAAAAAADDDAALSELHEATHNVGVVAHEVAVNTHRRSPAFGAAHAAVLATSPVPTAAFDAQRLARAQQRYAAADGAVTARGHATRARYNANEAPYVKRDSIVRVHVQVLAVLVAEYALRGAAIGDADSSKARSKARFGRESTATLASRINERLQALRAALRKASPALQTVASYVPPGATITVEQLSVIDAATRRGGRGGPAPHVLAAWYSIVRAHARSRRAMEEIPLAVTRLLAVLRTRGARRDACRAALDAVHADVRTVSEAMSASSSSAGSGAAGAATSRPAVPTLRSDAEDGGLPPSTRALLHPRAPAAAVPHEAPPGAALPQRYASTAGAVAEAYGLRHALLYLRGRAAMYAAGARDADALVESARRALRDARNVLQQAANCGAGASDAAALAPVTDAASATAAAASTAMPPAATAAAARPVAPALSTAAAATARTAASAVAHLDASVSAVDGGWGEWLTGTAAGGLSLAPDQHFVAVLDAVYTALASPRAARGGDAFPVGSADGVDSGEEDADVDSGDAFGAADGEGNEDEYGGDGGGGDDCADSDGDSNAVAGRRPAGAPPVSSAAAAAASQLGMTLSELCVDFNANFAQADPDSSDDDDGGDGGDLDIVISALESHLVGGRGADGDDDDFVAGHGAGGRVAFNGTLYDRTGGLGAAAAPSDAAREVDVDGARPPPESSDADGDARMDT